LDNHREYIENAIKPITKAKYIDLTKKKKKEGTSLEKKNCHDAFMYENYV
jgi:hypothetical protein